MFAHMGPNTVTVRGRVSVLSDWLLAEVKWCVKGHSLVWVWPFPSLIFSISRLTVPYNINDVSPS